MNKKKKFMALIQSILMIWGIIMCIMKFLGYISIPWWVATLPFYGGLVGIFLIACLFYVVIFTVGLIKMYKPGVCPLCGNKIKEN